ncbi:MAG TPA: excalibur calcium-binding domain-containing protein [Arachnia sp.]|nr:excalibur calcium-binding domain-containing protein [Arachnia sp.]HMT87570.1 excalibur calcium-binding domain-containing protein [Arachnia sp.]
MSLLSPGARALAAALALMLAAASPLAHADEGPEWREAASSQALPVPGLETSSAPTAPVATLSTEVYPDLELSCGLVEFSLPRDYPSDGRLYFYDPELDDFVGSGEAGASVTPGQSIKVPLSSPFVIVYWEPDDPSLDALVDELEIEQDCAPGATPRVSASSAGVKEVNQTTYAWGNATGFGAGATITVYTRVSTPSGMSRSQTTTAAPGTGAYTLPLTYGGGTPGVYTFDVVATDGVRTVTSTPFTLTRVKPTVTASSAGTKPVNQSTFVWGTTTGFVPGFSARVSTQVLIGGAWSTSQSTTTSQANTSYTLPLTYGASTPGTYTYRVVASDGYVTKTSTPFTLTRTRAAASSGTGSGSGAATGAFAVTAGAPAQALTNATATVSGKVSGIKSGTATVATQVKVNGAWSTSRQTTTTGSYSLPLTYGADQLGATTWRVRATVGGTSVYSSEFMLTRTGYANCTAVKNAKKAPIKKGQPGFHAALDRDSDGIGCER